MAVEDINIIIEDANETVSVTVNEVTEEVTVIVNDFSTSKLLSQDVGNFAEFGSDGLIYVPTPQSGGNVDSVNGKTGIVVLNTDDISEGVNNKYFTDARAKNAVISQAITNGVTDKSPSEDVVFDKLLLKQNLPTGFVSGLQLSIHPTDNTKAIIAPGVYIITDFSDVFNVQAIPVQVLTPIEFTPAYLLTSPSTYVALDINHNIVSSTTPFENDDRRTLCLIGNVVHSNNVNINVVNEIKAPIVAPTNQLHDLIKAVGFLNLDGNLFSPNGANLSLNKTAGRIFGLGINGGDYLDPHRLTLPQLTAPNFRYRLSVSPLVEFADTPFLNPTVYEPNGGGVLVPLTNNNRWSIQHINIFQSNIIRVQYGQHEYTSFVNARNAAFTESFTTEKNIADNAIFRCYVIMKKTCTDLSLDIANGDAEIIHIGKYGNAVGGSSAALTLANIISVLGYTPENEANKQNSLIVDGTGVKYPTVDAINSVLGQKQNTLTEQNFGAFANTLNIKLTPSANDEIVTLDSITGEAVTIKFSSFSGGVTILNTDILSSALTTKDVDGFIAYINALPSSFAVASNQIQYYTVMDIGMKFLIKPNGRSFGGSEPDITSSDVLQFGLDYFDNHFFKDYQVQSRGDATLTVIGSAGFLTTGTAGVPIGGTGMYSLIQSKTGVTSATTTAGSSCGYRDGAFQVFNFTLGFKINFKFANSDPAPVADARCFVGCTSTNAQIGNVNPSTLLSMFGIGSDNAEANLSIMHNDGSGTATKIPLGANFPANTSKVDIYSVTFWVFPGTTTLYYDVKRENTGHSASGKITTDINTALQYVPHFFRNNGATALAVNQTFFSIIAKLPF